MMNLQLFIYALIYLILYDHIILSYAGVAEASDSPLSST
ncbi:hypothetical protein DFP80_103217 [Marinomonas rhizomae]|uniref:Uncharacterized protein n=1 Tax=Marinomonas rhizomae TaxID=491948 RepID=A0A366JEL3_9GAMM|nr:hypothetical protein DFP80_103217 [Marinomonas rhizomae]